LKQRYIGFDVARAFAIFGMVVVNYKYVMHAWGGNKFLLMFTGLVQGRASILFVVLAGVGITLMSRRDSDSHSSVLAFEVRKRLVKRGLLLIALGYINTLIWPPDILHFYGFYFLIAAALYKTKDRTIIVNMLLMVAMFPILMVFFEYGGGWDSSHDPWSVKDIIFNGFYPVFPWCSFLLLGMWFGRQDFKTASVRKKIFIWSMAIWATTECIFWGIKEVISRLGLFNLSLEQVESWFSTSFSPPLPQYIIADGSLALALIITCFHLSERLSGNRLVQGLAKVGQLSLTLYVMHIVVGVGLVNAIDSLGNQTILFSFYSALIFVF